MPLGLPHSEFLTWSKDDQEKAIAYNRYERARCSQCGTRYEEWDPARGGDRDAYIGTVVRCPGCERLADENNNTQELPPSSRKGLHPRLKPEGVTLPGELDFESEGL